MKLTVFSMVHGISVEKQFDSGRLTTTEDVQRAVSEALDLPGDCKDVFSIWLSSQHLRKSAMPYRSLI